MLHVQAPQNYVADEPFVFLAGGISDTENWQADFVRRMRACDVTIVNPRRASYPTNDAAEGRRQIEWEHDHLRRASLVAFWFPPQTVCPIALFELGTCCAAGVPLVVGADRHYARRFDLEVQLQLRRPEVALLDSIGQLANHVAHHPAFTGART